MSPPKELYAITKALKEYLRKTGYDFTEYELMRAMASCMEEMERMTQSSP